MHTYMLYRLSLLAFTVTNGVEWNGEESRQELAVAARRRLCVLLISLHYRYEYQYYCYHHYGH